MYMYVHVYTCGTCICAHVHELCSSKLVCIHVSCYTCTIHMYSMHICVCVCVVYILYTRVCGMHIIYMCMYMVEKAITITAVKTSKHSEKN